MIFSEFHNVTANIRQRLKGSEYLQFADDTTTVTMLQSYHAILADGSGSQLEWTTRPSKTGYGTPTLLAASTISKISKRSQLPLANAVAFANALAWEYFEGDVDPRDYAPIIYSEDDKLQMSLEAQAEKKQEQEAVADTLKALAKSAGKGVGNITLLVGAVALVYGLSIVGKVIPKRR